MMERISEEEACELQRPADFVCTPSQMSLIRRGSRWEKMERVDKIRF